MSAWLFVALITVGGTDATVRSPRYATEVACETARSAWLRAQGSVFIRELGPCHQIRQGARP